MNLNPLTWLAALKGSPTPPANMTASTWLPPVDWLTHKPRLTERDLVNLFRDTAYYCANLNARGVARTPLCLYRKRGTGERQGPATRKASRESVARMKAAGYGVDDDSVEEVLAHPFLDLLDRPFLADGVPIMGRFQLLEITQLYLEIVGRAYWEMDLGGTEAGPPSQLFPLVAHEVQPYRDANSRRFVDRYDYTAEGLVRQINPVEVVAFLCPSLSNPYTGGMSPMQAAAERLGVSLSYLSQTQALLNNRARPDVIISAKGQGDVISKPTRDRLLKWFKQAFSRRNIGSPLVSMDPVDVHPLTFNPKDMGELQDEAHAIKQIGRVFDIPQSMLDKDATRANAAEGRKQHAHEALEPRCRRVEHVVNASILPRYGDAGRLFCVFDEPYHEPLAPEAKDVPALVNVVFTPDEARERFGYGPMPEEHKAEMERVRQEELAAKKPPEQPGMSPKDAKSYLDARTAIRNGRPIRVCRH